MLKLRKTAVLLLCLSLFLGQIEAAIAGPVYGVDFQKQAFQRTLQLMSTPDPYTRIPAGRAGGTIGLAVLPRLTADADDAEKALGVLAGHIPAINMVITLPNNDIMYLFKFLKHLKASGKRVDVLLIGGHALASDPDNPVPLAINLKASGVIDTVNINVGLLQRRIEQLSAEGKNPQKVKEICEQLKLIRDASSALVPGAQLLLHSCYMGSKGGENLTKIIGTSVLGVNGGVVYGPEKEVGHTVLSLQDAKDDPKTFTDKVKALLHQRSIQLCQSLKSKTWISPGEAFINSNQFYATKVPSGLIQIPCQCDGVEKAGGIEDLKRNPPQIQEENPSGNVKFQVSENSITGTQTVAGTSYSSTVNFTPPPPVVTQRTPFAISGSLSGDVKNTNTSCSVFKGLGFDMPDGFFIDQGKASDRVELVTWTNPSERQRREMFVGIRFTFGGACLTETWNYSLPEKSASLASTDATLSKGAVPATTYAPKSPNTPVVGMMSKVGTPQTKTGKQAVSRVLSGPVFRRTGPFVTQKNLIPNTKVQVSIGENSITYTGPDMYQKENVSCTLKFDAPPEEIAVGDNFMLTASLSGHEDVAPICSFLPGSWIKSATKENTIGLGRDYCVPSNSSSYQVVDNIAEFDRFAKANPAMAAQHAASRNALPSMKLSCSGQVVVGLEWKYVRK